MTARARFNEKKGIAIILLFTILSIYSLLAELLGGEDLSLVVRSLENAMPSDMPSASFSVSDYYNFPVKTKWSRTLINLFGSTKASFV
jgi:hypothetical protein